MPIFEYKALTEAGRTKTGILDADTPREARNRLHKQKIHVIEIHQLGGAKTRGRSAGGSRAEKLLVALSTRRESVATLSNFTRQFATLLKAGTPLAECLQVLIEQMPSRRFEAIVRDVRERVTAGESLAEAMSNHPGAFNDLYVSMVRAGEVSGHLDEVLARIGAYLNRQNRLKNKILSALMYPMIMVAAGVLVVSVLMKFVVPKILKLVTARGGELPMPTRILKSVSEFFNQYWILLVILVIGLMVIFKAVRQQKQGRYLIDRICLSLPIFGDLFRKQAISRFATTLATLLRSGVPVLEALQIVQDVVDNSVMSQVIGQVRERIVEGTDISTPLKKSKMFPPVVGHMIAVGEQSGQLEDILAQLSEAYDEEIDISAQRMTALLEPVLIISIAVVVAFIVLAVVLPMLRLGRNLGN